MTKNETAAVEAALVEAKTSEKLAGEALKEATNLMALMLWKMRHSLPALVIQITPADREAFKQSLNYNEQTVKVNIDDRGGTTLIHLTDQKTGDQIICTENNEADLDKAQAMANLRMIKQTAPDLASRLLSDTAQGNMNSSLIEEACRSLMALART